MVRYSFLLAAFCLAPSVAFAQRLPADPPVAGRPENFSNIVGKYTISVTAEPTDVHVEEPITLKVRITGEGLAKFEPKRQHLQILPDWKDDFYVENVPDEDRVLPKEKTWLFVYRLSPKHVDVKEIGGIELAYYDPLYVGKKKYLADYAPALPLNVKPKPESGDVRIAAKAVPDSFYTIDETSNPLRRRTPSLEPSAFSTAILLAGTPLFCFVGALAWRRVFPDARTHQTRHRSHSAQRALARLQAGSDLAWVTVCRYLQERFEFQVAAPTPADVAAFLKRRGFAGERCVEALAFFQKCDAVRFTGETIDANVLIGAAAQLIQALEADPCAR